MWNLALQIICVIVRVAEDYKAKMCDAYPEELICIFPDAFYDHKLVYSCLNEIFFKKRIKYMKNNLFRFPIRKE